jgi:hypothetical protein
MAAKNDQEFFCYVHPPAFENQLPHLWNLQIEILKPLRAKVGPNDSYVASNIAAAFRYTSKIKAKHRFGEITQL